MISTLERPTLSAQVAQHLLDLISRNRLRPGDQVPSEIQLCRDLKVSRGCVREAYRTLAALGVIEIETGRRPRLRIIDMGALSKVFSYALITAQISLAQVIETRRAIEVQSAQLAARHATDEQRKLLRELVAEMRASHDDEQRRIAADISIHTALAEASLNSLNALLLTALRSSLEASMHVDLSARRSEAELIRIVDAHEAIVDRVCAGDPVGAGAAMAYHFDLSIMSMKRAEPAGVVDGPAACRVFNQVVAGASPATASTRRRS